MSVSIDNVSINGSYKNFVYYQYNDETVDKRYFYIRDIDGLGERSSDFKVFTDMMNDAKGKGGL